MAGDIKTTKKEKKRRIKVVLGIEPSPRHLCLTVWPPTENGSLTVNNYARTVQRYPMHHYTKLPCLFLL